MARGMMAGERRVEEHQLCAGCEYDLFGLTYGGRCPECGAPIRIPSRVPLTINDASIEYVAALRLGVAALLVGAGSVVVFIVGMVMPPSEGGTPIMLLALLMSTAWCYGVYILTRPLPGETLAMTPEQIGLRWGARGLCASWLLVMGLPLAWRAGVMPNAPWLAVYLLWVLGLAGACTGFVLLSVLVARLVAWANDVDLGHRLRVSAMAVGIMTGIFVLLTALSVLGFPAPILLIPYVMATAAGLAITIWIMYLYARVASIAIWAPTNARRSIERLRVRGERIAQRLADAEAKPEPVPQFNVVKPPVRGTMVAQAQDPAYDIAPDEPSVPPAPQPVQQPLQQPVQKPAPIHPTLAPIPKRKPEPKPDVNRRKDEMI